MPKTYTHPELLKEQRLRHKEKSQKYVSGNVVLTVLGSGSKGTPKSLYLFTGQSSYLFNCGEGLQRLAYEHKRKLSKLDNVFITYSSWSNLGGLPGLALTVQDVGLPQITLHGPDGVENIFSATRRFIILNSLSIEAANCSPNQDFEDETLMVKYVPLVADSPSPNEPNQRLPCQSIEQFVLVEDDTDYYGHERSEKGKTGSPSRSENENSLKRKDTNQMSNQDLKKMKIVSPGNTSMAYICQLKPKLGTLDIEKCVDLNVPIGPLLGQLKAGKDVTLPDGTEVKASEVKRPDQPGPILIVVECPTSSFIDVLVRERTFEKYQKSGNKEDEAYLIAHFSPPEVMKDPRYESWMNKFSPATKHLILNESNKCSGSTAVHRIQQQLNLIDTSMFPLLKDSTIPVEVGDAEEESKDSFSEGVSKNDSGPIKNSLYEFDIRSPDETAIKEIFDPETNSVIHGRTLLAVHLRPHPGVQSDQCLVCKPKEYIKTVFNEKGFREELDTLHNRLKNLPPDSTDYPKVLFLGTGSSIPSKVRNTSGILVQFNAETCMLFDCGEGTHGQLVRFFGTEESDQILSNLKAVYISHLHADHHLGLVGLFQARRKAMSAKDFSPTYLLAPHQILAWLNVFHQNFEPILHDFKLIPNAAFSVEDECLPTNDMASLLDTLSLKKIQTTKVAHCPNSFGISLTHLAGWKMTYSGDTRPCDALINIGMDSDLLIHEATMEDDLSNEAFIKMHSTTSQAIEIGRRMNAKFTLLTHFSQRYAKLPHLTGNYDNVGVAFDNMQVRLCDLKKLPLMIPALQLMFADQVEDMKLKSHRRRLKEELLISN